LEQANDVDCLGNFYSFALFARIRCNRDVAGLQMCIANFAVAYWISIRTISRFHFGLVDICELPTSEFCELAHDCFTNFTLLVWAKCKIDEMVSSFNRCRRHFDWLVLLG
jgi:hypothetical protein